MQRFVTRRVLCVMKYAKQLPSFAQSCCLLIAVTGKVNKTLFQATIGQSYMCNSEQDLNMTTNIHSLKVTMSDVQLQAFGKTNSTQFETGEQFSVTHTLVLHHQQVWPQTRTAILQPSSVIRHSIEISLHVRCDLRIPQTYM